MNRNDVIELFKVMTTFDRRYDKREATDADIKAWLAAVGDLDFEDARMAIVGHYRDTDAWLMPVHVRRRVAQIRAERLQRAPTGPPSEDLAVIDNPGAYLRALRSQIARGASSDTGPRAIGGSQ